MLSGEGSVEVETVRRWLFGVPRLVGVTEAGDQRLRRLRGMTETSSLLTYELVDLPGECCHFQWPWYTVEEEGRGVLGGQLGLWSFQPGSLRDPCRHLRFSDLRQHQFKFLVVAWHRRPHLLSNDSLAYDSICQAAFSRISTFSFLKINLLSEPNFGAYFHTYLEKLSSMKYHS